MPKSAMIRARVAPELKDRAEAVLEQLGLSATTAITLFYRQIVQQRGLPFDLRVPTPSTQRAMRDARSGRSVVKAKTMDELFGELDSRGATNAAPLKKGRAQSAR